MDELSIDKHSDLPGTVSYYRKHIIVCTGRNNWPSRIQDERGFIKDLSDALFDPSNNQTDIKVTACDLPSEGYGTSVYVYPENVRIHGLRQEDMEAFNHFLITGESKTLRIEKIDQTLVLICVHQNRDARCGFIGSKLIDVFKSKLEQYELTDRVLVSASSHLSGHKFAGVAVIYPSANWYGRLTENEVSLLIESEFVQHQPLRQHWRGKIQMKPEEQLQFTKDQGWNVVDQNYGIQHQG